jgi:flagellar protein FlgJ
MQALSATSPAHLSALSGLATDTRPIAELRGLAARDPQAATREVARQFEAMFMHELLRSMRQATLASGLLDNAATGLGTEMLDAQYAQKLAGLRGGLADVIARQIAQQMGLPPPDAPAAARGVGAASPPSLLSPPGGPAAAAATEPTADADPAAPAPLRRATDQIGKDFIARHLDAARAAEAASGIPAAFMLAQAALETGWGRRDIRLPDGAPSNNLFGIKAGPGWRGPVTEITTTEYIGGVPRSVRASFRAYASIEESFADYARLITQSRRYAEVVAQAGTAQGFAQALQRAGFATDPAYADKLSGVINTTLRLKRALA